MAGRVLAPFCALLVIASVAPARAWTTAHVRDVRAEIALERDGRAHVSLELGVEVMGGWLERLDLAGLDEDLVLAAEAPASLTTADGASFTPEVRVREGELELRFDKSMGVRRGLHRVGVRYDTVLLGRATQPGEAGFTRVCFTLPGWEAGLDSAEIRWLVPSASRGIADESVAAELTSEPPSGGRRVIRFARVHVPRSTPWEVAVDVPERELSAESATHATSAEPGSKRAPRPWTTGPLLVSIVLALGWLARKTARHRAHREGAEASPLVPSSVRSVVRVLALAASPFAWREALPVALALSLLTALSFVDVYARAPRPLPLGGFAPLARDELRAMARARFVALVGGLPWADLTSLFGALGALALVAGIMCSEGALDTARDPWGLGLACALVGWIASSRLRRPRSLAERVALLASAARGLVTVGSALRLVWYVPQDAEPSEPRLRLISATRYPGLLRVDVLTDTRRHALPLALAVVVETDSPCDRWVAEALPRAERELSEGGRRAVHLMPLVDATETLEGLFAMLAARAQQSLEAGLADAREAA